MRYVVRFANAQLLRLAEEGALAGEPFPEGVYRALDVWVEADTPDHALERAVEMLGWPDQEIDLAPLAVTSDAEMRGNSAVVASARALMDFWTKHDLLRQPTEIAELAGLRPRRRTP